MNILITGGACAGKTTSINFISEYLTKREYKVCIKEEMPTKLINSGIKPQGIDFINLIIENQLNQLGESDNEFINIFDGSPLDAIKFINKHELDEILSIYNTSVKDVLEHYDYIIHLESVAVSMPEKYSNENNKARTLNVEESAKREKRLLDLYSQCHNRYIVSTYENFEDKINEIKKIISEIVNRDVIDLGHRDDDKVSLNIVEEIKEELLKRNQHTHEKDGYDFWEDHIKFVFNHATALAVKYNADIEIVQLAALLHDISMVSYIGPREEHHIYGCQIAEELLSQRNYPKEKLECVKACILNHRGSKDMPRATIEEKIIADADVLAHFDAIPSLFSLAFNEIGLNLHDGTEFVKDKLRRDYNKLSDETRIEINSEYEKIMKILFK